MEVTISLIDGSKWLLLIALIVLVVFCCVAVGHLITTIKSTNKMLNELEDVSRVLSQRTNDVDALIDKAAEAVAEKDGVSKTVSSIASTVASVRSIFSSKKNED